MSPTDRSYDELAWLLAADLARRCVAACEQAGLARAADEETVTVDGDELMWHVQAGYERETGIVQLEGHTHFERSPAPFPFQALFPGADVRLGSPRSAFAFCLPASWLPAVDVPRPKLCGAEADPQDPTRMPGTYPCGLDEGHMGPHSWQARGRE